MSRTVEPSTRSASARFGLQRMLSRLTIRAPKPAFLPTWYGLVYLAMVAALLIGSINHNNNLGYLLTFLLVGILLVSIRYGWRNLGGITLLGGQAAPVFAGQTARFDLHLRTASGARYGLVFALDPDHQVAADLADAGATTVLLPAQAERRGALRFATLQVATSYPLGLFTLRADKPVYLACTVYPRPLSAPAAGEGGDHRQDQPGRPRQAGRDFAGLTHYQPGDSPRQIHWKSLAAGKGLFTKFFAEGQTDGTLFSLEDLPEAGLETRLSWLCHLVVAAEAQGLRYGLRLGEQVIALGRGAAHRHRCLTALALYR